MRKRKVSAALDDAVKALQECREDRTAVHERLREALQERDEAVQARDEALRERAFARDGQDAAIGEREGMRELLVDAQSRLTESLGQRDEWAATAHANARGRDEAQREAREMREDASRALDALEALRLATQQHESRTAEAVALAEAAERARAETLAERDEAVFECASAQEDSRVLAERLQHAEDANVANVDALAAEQRKSAEARQALADCRQSRGIMQAQRDEALARVGAAEPPRQRVTVSSSEAVPLMSCSQMGPHMGHVWWGRFDREPELGEKRWCDGRNPDGSTPYDPAVTAGQVMSEDREDPGLAGWVTEPQRFEDVAFDAMRDALLAITATEAYDADEVAAKLKRALGMLDGEGRRVRSEPGGALRASADSEPGDRGDRTLIEHWQGVAKRLEEQIERLAGPVRAGFLTHTPEQVVTLTVDLLALLRDQRDEAVARQDAVLADNRTLADRANEATARADRVERERDAARAERDEARGWIGAVNEALGDHRTQAVFVDDAVKEVVRKLHAAIQRENDAVPALGSVLIDGALENALGKLVGVLGVEAYESPADVIDTAMEAIKDARREAGRLKLVLDIIDERKAAQPVEVERRGHEDV